MDIAHPESANYGKHWTAQQVAETFRPSQGAVETVHGWLAASGVHHERIAAIQYGSWIEANVTIDEAEMLLGTEYYVYQHEADDREHLACAEKYHLPKHVSEHVEIVTPTLHFDSAHSRRGYNAPRHELRDVAAAATGPGQRLAAWGGPKVADVITELASSNDVSNCSAQITPACLRALYQFEYTPVSKNNSIAITEYTPQAYIASDLDLFFGNFSPSQIGQRPNLSSIDGGYIQTNANQSGVAYNGESNLDLQYAMTLVGPNQTVQLYQTGDNVEFPGFNNMLNALDGSYCTFEGGNDPAYDGIYPDPSGGYRGPENCGTVTPAYVMSTSYQFDEANFTPFYMQRQCAEYAKLGLMGVTLLYVSGDNGVAGGSSECLYTNGTKGPDGKIFSPTFPSTCPYVTSVGATQINPGSSITDPESACETEIYSSGGWSNVFAMPSYQAGVVPAYLKNYPPPYAADLWNSTGGSRAFPDVSVNGANYAIALQGQYQLVSGTSAASPTFAAILSAVNDARLAVGKGPIGFINPVIYSAAGMTAFNDITNGTNPGCGTEGFSARPGWDPVTGLGTPNFPKLLEFFLGMP